MSNLFEPDVDVTDQAIVSHHLCIYCIILLPAPKLLLMLVFRKIPGCFLKFEHHTIHTKCKSRKVELLPHSVCCLFQFHICRHVGRCTLSCDEPEPWSLLSKRYEQQTETHLHIGLLSSENVPLHTMQSNAHLICKEQR